MNGGGLSYRASHSRIYSSVKPLPDLDQVVDSDFSRLCHEDDSKLSNIWNVFIWLHPTDSIFIIPCRILSIGAWNRVNFEGYQNFVAWICKEKRCFVWFVQSRDYGFKMQVPLDNLKGASISNVGSGEVVLTLELIRCPEFFLRQNHQQGGVPLPCWSPYIDWTENQAATRCLHHVLRGSRLPLVHVYFYILGYKRNATPAVPRPLADESSVYPTLASATPTHLSPIPDYIPYPHGLSVRDSAPTAEYQTPSYDAKPLPNTYLGRDQPQPSAVHNVKQYEDIYAEQNVMVPSGADVGVAAAPLGYINPWPGTCYSENDQPSAYASGNGHNHHQVYSMPPIVPNESQRSNFSDSQFHYTN